MSWWLPEYQTDQTPPPPYDLGTVIEDSPTGYFVISSICSSGYRAKHLLDIYAMRAMRDICGGKNVKVKFLMPWVVMGGKLSS